MQVLSEGAVRFAWPASQLRVRFKGSALRASIEDQPLADALISNDLLALELDGKPLPKRALATGRHDYTLVERIPFGEHTLVITKRTEANVGTITLHGFRQDADTQLLAAPVRRKRRIEVLGDSISAGYGAEGRGPGCSYDAAQQDAAHGYAAVAADVLSAELVVQAWSGKGVLRNVDARDQDTLPMLYGRVLPALAEPRIALDFAPHVIVVHLGTNDFAAGEPPAAPFVAAYLQLLLRLHAQSPAASFVLVVSPMINDQHPYPHALRALRGDIVEVQTQATARGLEVALVDQVFVPGEPVGCHWHPSVAQHARFGAELAQRLRAELGW